MNKEEEFGCDKIIDYTHGRLARFCEKSKGASGIFAQVIFMSFNFKLTFLHVNRQNEKLKKISLNKTPLYNLYVYIYICIYIHIFFFNLLLSGDVHKFHIFLFIQTVEIDKVPR